MKPNFITQMKAEIALKMELKYAALYHAQIGMTLQLAQDAAMIAANEVLQMGPKRAPDFAAVMRDTVNEIADVMLADQKDDEKFAYTRGRGGPAAEKNMRGEFRPLGGTLLARLKTGSCCTSLRRRRTTHSAWRTWTRSAPAGLWISWLGTG